MTKRCGGYQDGNGKKPKLDDDEIWDEDLDDEALDKCFELATQVCKEEWTQSNASILPSYNAFKNPTVFASSTQVNTASTSKSIRPTLFELEAEVQRLKVQNEEKDGEICILRSKIKETSNVVQVEQQRTTNEWREKFIVTQKEVRLMKSDLEFKNLEVANLKQQLAELRRLNLESAVNNTQQCVPSESHVKVNPERTTVPSKKKIDEQVHREAIMGNIYPMKCLSPKNFEAVCENHVIKNTSYKVSRNTIPYLQNQQTHSDLNLHHQCAKIVNAKICLETLYPEVLKLVSSTLDQLNSGDNIEALSKLIVVSIISLQDLNEYLIELGTNLRTEDIQQADTNYLIHGQQSDSNQTLKVCENELGIQSARLLEVLAQIILYNPYTADFICWNKPLKITKNIQNYVNLLPNKNVIIENDYFLLKLLLNILKHIGKYRLASQMNEFLMSVLNILINIVLLDNQDYVCELMTKRELYFDLFKELVFARPGPRIIHRITCLLKVGSHNKFFVQYLFNRKSKHPLLKTDTKGVLYYTPDACSFCVLGILLQNYSLQTKKLPLEVYYNMVAFIYNTFKISHWIHHENSDSVCGCLSQLYKLEIDFVFRALEDFVEYFSEENSRNQFLDDWKMFLQHEIVQKVLNQMNFNNFELTEKYVIVYSQFKQIESILRDQGYFNITELNTSEEILKIPKERFKQDF